MTTQVQYRIDQRGIREAEQILTRFDVERAWADQVQAVDRWQMLASKGRDQYIVDQAWDEMQEATRHAMQLERTFADQYERRQYQADGRWTVKAVG